MTSKTVGNGQLSISRTLAWLPRTGYAAGRKTWQLSITLWQALTVLIISAILAYLTNLALVPVVAQVEREQDQAACEEMMATYPKVVWDNEIGCILPEGERDN